MAHTIIMVAAEAESLHCPVAQGRFGISVVAAVDQDKNVKKYTPVRHVRHGKAAIKPDEYGHAGQPGAHLQQPAHSSGRRRPHGRNADDDDNSQKDQGYAVI